MFFNNNPSDRSRKLAINYRALKWKIYRGHILFGIIEGRARMVLEYREKKKKKKFRSLYGYTHDKIEIFGGQYAETIKK